MARARARGAASASRRSTRSSAAGGLPGRLRAGAASALRVAAAASARLIALASLVPNVDLADHHGWSRSTSPRASTPKTAADSPPLVVPRAAARVPRRRRGRSSCSASCGSGGGPPLRAARARLRRRRRALRARAGRSYYALPAVLLPLAAGSSRCALAAGGRGDGSRSRRVSASRISPLRRSSRRGRADPARAARSSRGDVATAVLEGRARLARARRADRARLALAAAVAAAGGAIVAGNYGEAGALSLSTARRAGCRRRSRATSRSSTGTRARMPQTHAVLLVGFDADDARALCRTSTVLGRRRQPLARRQRGARAPDRDGARCGDRSATLFATEIATNRL